MRIELTNEIAKAIEYCQFLKNDTVSDICKKYCPLSGACLEYWTGDNSLNKEE